MAIVANTFQTYQAKGIREDLNNVISDISPEDTPFMSNIGRAGVSNTYFEWQQDTLATPATNAQIEGDDLTSFTAVVPTVRIGNYTQISRKDVIIAGTEDTAVDKAGRKSELAYQLAKKSKEIKRDMETMLLDNVAANAGTTSVARRTAGLGAWIRTAQSIGVGGVAPSAPASAPLGTRTDGTQRAFTEALLKDAIQQSWVVGGAPKMLMVGAFNKQAASAFAGIATKTFYTSAVKVTAIIGAADVYVSDFGNLSIVPNRFQRARDAWLLDPEYAKLRFLRPFNTVELAKTGDAEKRMIIVEYGLEVTNEKAHAIVADLTTS